MRSNLELWEIVRDNFDRYWDVENIDGLCMLIYAITLNIITVDEWCILNDELCDEKSKLNTYKAYWLGKRGDAEPRKEFIEKMIKKHKNIL